MLNEYLSLFSEWRCFLSCSAAVQKEKAIQNNIPSLCISQLAKTYCLILDVESRGNFEQSSGQTGMGIRFVTAHNENWCDKVWLWSYHWETEPVLRPSSHTQQPCSENIHREFLETCLAIQIPVYINHRINSPMDYHL